MSVKKIYFASDFHLGAPNQKDSLIREKKVVRWLDLVKDDEGYRVSGIEIQADNNEQIASVRLNELQ